MFENENSHQYASAQWPGSLGPYPMSCSWERSLEKGMKSVILKREMDFLDPRARHYIRLSSVPF